ncbi:hypothetical protein AB5J56_21270 [Streptomyces sp. R21]|uniref:DUF4232 domain-containing protein n=1 Tax=Streptomyces sp. R21 TaxID=3238627 RepID=A0AB39PB68_9ACTN
MSGYGKWRRRDEDPRPGHEHEHEQSHAGNGIVNHGPDGQDHGGQSPGDHELDGQGLGLEGLLGSLGRSADGQGSQGSKAQGVNGLSSKGQGVNGLGSDALGADELALRRLLHQAVQEIEPTDGTLDHLRRAVPARRARKRQAVVGMAAAALFIGTAIPALVHVSNATGSGADPSIAGNSSQTQGGANQGKETDGGSRASGGSSTSSHGKGKGDQKGQKGNGKSAGTTTGGGSADPSASVAATAECTAAQLGAGAGSAGGPDSTGVVYGSLPISNISTTACTVTGAGGVSTAVAGAADASKVSVSNHVAGDAAVGLPDPSTEVAQLLLQPGTSYVVKFAWVPSETCPTTGGSTGSTDPTPTPTPSETATDTGGTTTTTDGTTGEAPQLVAEEGVADGSVTVSLTAAAGSATTSATVSNACSGTVYRTGMLAS